ncbi:hypothetical protein BT69DRAFT_1324629 [Atractiella rhizophila]|nr:hypothetical protein BT69DRAFT_1324629 [Atractiella rhizophila]
MTVLVLVLLRCGSGAEEWFACSLACAVGRFVVSLGSLQSGSGAALASAVGWVMFRVPPREMKVGFVASRVLSAGLFWCWFVAKWLGCCLASAVGVSGATSRDESWFRSLASAVGSGSGAASRVLSGGVSGATSRVLSAVGVGFLARVLPREFAVSRECKLERLQTREIANARDGKRERLQTRDCKLAREQTRDEFATVLLRRVAHERTRLQLSRNKADSRQLSLREHDRDQSRLKNVRELSRGEHWGKLPRMVGSHEKLSPSSREPRMIATKGTLGFNPGSFRNEIQSESLPAGHLGYNPAYGTTLPIVGNRILAESLPPRGPGYNPACIRSKILAISLPPSHSWNEIQAESLPPGCLGYNPTSVRNKILATSLPLSHPGYDPDAVANRIPPTSLPPRCLGYNPACLTNRILAISLPLHAAQIPTLPLPGTGSWLYPCLLGTQGATLPQ